MAWQIIKQTPNDGVGSQDLTTLVFTWTKVTDTTLEPRIRFLLSVNSDLSSPIVDTFLIGADQYSFSGRVLSNQTYYWNAYYESTSPDPAWSFISKPATVSLVSPIGSSDISTKPTLVFLDDDNFGNYQIELSTNSDFTGTAGVSYWQYTTTLKSFVPSANLPNSKLIYWRVRPYLISNIGDWSASGSFTTTYGLPSIPILSSPANGETGVELDASLIWTGSDGATSQIIYIDTSQSFTSFTKIDVTTAKTTSLPSGTLVNNTVYYWKVVARNSAGETISGTGSFTTKGADTTSKPVLVSPSGNITVLNPLLEWTQSGIVSTGTTWQVQISTTSDYSNIVLDQDNLSFKFYQLLTALSYSTTYYWRARAVNSGIGSLWSASLSFTTPNEGEGDGPDTPVWIYPANDATDLPTIINFRWSEVAGAFAYDLEIIDSSGNTVIGIGVLTNSYTTAFADLNYGKLYTARVRAQNVDGISAWASIQFKTLDLLTETPPTITYPQNGDNDVPNIFTMTWEYDMEAWINPKFRVQLSPVVDFSWNLDEEISLQTTEKTYNWEELTNQYDQLYARVMAYNNSGASAWSTIITFYKESQQTPPKPIIIYPEQNQEGVSIPVRIDWESQNNTSYFQVMVATTIGFDDGTIVHAGAGISNSFLDVANLNINTDYYVRVRGFNEYTFGNGIGEWSDVVSFNTNKLVAPGLVKLLIPENQKPNVNITPAPTFKWSPVDYATMYRLRIYIQLPIGPKSGAIYEKINIYDTEFTIPEGILLKDHKYWWTVQAYNDAGFSVNFEYFSFKTENEQQPGKPTITHPENYQGGVGVEPLFTWEDENNTAVKYILEASTTEDFSELVFKSEYIYDTLLYYSTASIDNSQVFTSLELDSQYYARVRGYKSDNGFGDYSDTVTFMTKDIPAPLKPSVTTPLKNASVDNLFTIEWDEALYANSYIVEIADKSTFANPIIKELVNTNSLEVSLFKGKDYYLRVQGIGVGGYGQFVVVKFKTNA